MSPVHVSETSMDVLLLILVCANSRNNSLDFASMEIAVNPDAKTVQVKRELESNLFEKVEIPLPAVLAIQSGINQPRYATLKGIMQAKKKEIKTLSSQDLRLESGDVGPAGSRVDHQKLSFPEKKKKTVLIEGEPEEAAKQLMEKLRKEARVL